MVTLKEIGAAVGVSSAAVSRVLNFDMTLAVTAQTRQAILETAEALNYATPRNRNRAARIALTKVALVHFLGPEQELSDPYYIALRLGIERRCAELRIETVKVYHTDLRPDAGLLQEASSVIAIGRHSKEEMAWLKHHGRTVVFADFSPPGEEFDCVESELVYATQTLLDGLESLGYESIGFVGWLDRDQGSDPGNVEKRCRANIDWMTERGRFDSRLCLTETNTEDSGYRLTRKILDQGFSVDALVTGNDNMAVGAYRAVHELRLRIPDDIAIASFNDISVAQFMNPPLSTVHFPSKEIGETAVELLQERLAGRDIAKRITLASGLIWRSSTRSASP